MARADEAVGPVIGHIQTDTFCECGYNLHTQAVMRDGRLGIVVCRCPECGRFTPAGHGATATRVWLNRLATVVLFVWSLILLVLFALCTLFLGMTAYGHLMNNVSWTQLPVSGAPGQSHYEYRIVTPPPGDRSWAERQRVENVMMALLAGALGLVTGVLFTILLWHVRWPLRALAWLPPLAGCSVAALGWVNDSMTVNIRQWGLRWIVAYCALQCVGVGIGLLLGRPVARGVLRLLLPPKPRQHLAFLWTVDGKRLTLAGGETHTPG